MGDRSQPGPRFYLPMVDDPPPIESLLEEIRESDEEEAGEEHP
ncbi:MAG TPA: hypothetical protein VFN89_06150 [Solirubrobacterales bacterium]|nr:hypothetical protein [Solirubrobacterales bacterium]